MVEAILQPDVEPTVAIVDAVADAAGVDASDLDQPLGEQVDADALDQLVRSASGDATDVHVRFRYLDHDVAVHSDGRVVVQ
ncbi:HalOD1 output domain-containing protein [Halobacteriales archaeon Cl-PHB]